MGMVDAAWGGPTLEVTATTATLHAEAAAVFADHRARAAVAADRALSPAGAAAYRAALTLQASQWYRRAIASCTRTLEAAASAQGGSDAAADAAALELEVLQVVHAVWQAAEVALLHDGPSARIALLGWLRDTFLDPPQVNDALLAAAVNGLRGAAALGGGRSASTTSTTAHVNDAWDVAAKLAVEGRPGDAGRLLAVVSAAVGGDAEVAAIGHLLTGFPVFDAAAEEAGAAYAAAWDGWHARAVALRDGGAGRGLHPVAQAVVALLAGDVPDALSRLQYAGSLVRDAAGGGGEQGAAAAGAPPPYGRWYHAAFAGALYGAPPTSLRRRGFGAHLRAAMLAAGEPLAASEAALAAATAGGASNPAAELTAGFLSIFRGDAGWPLSVVHRLGHSWAAAHLCDLLWGAGLMDNASGSAPPSLWPGHWAAPVRAHLLLQHAVTLATPTSVLAAAGSVAPQLPTRLWRQAVAYAVACTPEAVTRESSAAGAARLSSASAADAQVAAALAAQTGSAPAAHLLLRLLLARAAPAAASERDAATVAALAVKLGLPDVACDVRAQWAEAAAAGAGQGTALGTALAAAVGAVAECPHTSTGGNACASVTRAVDAVGRLLADTVLADVTRASASAPAGASGSARGSSAARLSGVALSSALADGSDAAFAAAGVAFDAAAAASDEAARRAHAALEDAAVVSRHLRYAVALRRYAGCLVAAAAPAACEGLHGLLDDGERQPLCPRAHVPRLLQAAVDAGVLAPRAGGGGASPELLQLALVRLRESGSGGADDALSQELARCLAHAALKA